MLTTTKESGTDQVWKSTTKDEENTMNESEKYIHPSPIVKTITRIQIVGRIISFWARQSNSQEIPGDLDIFFHKYSIVISDTLKFAKHPDVQKMLLKMGSNFPKKEEVILSLKLTNVPSAFPLFSPPFFHAPSHKNSQINKRGKHQNRVLLLTDKALSV